jgi:hypothetical protein
MHWTVAIGVDTHKHVHVAVALDRFGAQLGSRQVATTETGYRSLLAWALELGLPAFAVEGCGSYGAGLVRFLELAGVAVWECERPRRRERRRGKSDLIDAALAARRLLTGDGLCLPRGGGRREELRLLLLERRSAIQARTAALNQLSALVVTAPEPLRERLSKLSGERLARAAARLRPGADVGTAVLHRLGRRGRATQPRGGRGRPQTARDPHRGRARSARRVWRRTDLRRAATRLQRRSQPDDKRSILRRARRHQPPRRLKRTTATPPTEPRRRPPAQPGPARHRARPHPPPR